MREKLDNLVNHFSNYGSLVLLESQSKSHKASRYTLLAAQAKATITAYGNKIEVREGEKKTCFNANPWEALAVFRQKQDDYLFGYLGYDLKNYNEHLTSFNNDETGAPDLFFMVPSVLFKIDAQGGEMEVIKGSVPNNTTQNKEAEPIKIGAIQSSVGYQEYITIVNRIKDDIYEGDYYELNYTHPLCANFSGSPYQLYGKMRQLGPGPFGAYLKIDDLGICCFSPERFLRKAGKKLLSQPIKGTIKSVASQTQDAVLKAKLQQSEKERAENLMIVDLVRNDLSRVSRAGTVHVNNLYEIQSFANVHQMVSTISAVSAEDNPVEIIKACFPMGSMTGAPKVKVMQAIEAYENYKRGIYSGAIGYFTPDDDFDFNVVIRTAILKGRKLYFPVGGAITADSDPESEWQESLLKAESLNQVL